MNHTQKDLPKDHIVVPVHTVICLYVNREISFSYTKLQKKGARTKRLLTNINSSTHCALCSSLQFCRKDPVTVHSTELTSEAENVAATLPQNRNTLTATSRD